MNRSWSSISRTFDSKYALLQSRVELSLSIFLCWASLSFFPDSDLLSETSHAQCGPVTSDSGMSLRNLLFWKCIKAVSRRIADILGLSQLLAIFLRRFRFSAHREHTHCWTNHSLYTEPGLILLCSILFSHRFSLLDVCIFSCSGLLKQSQSWSAKGYHDMGQSVHHISGLFCPPHERTMQPFTIRIHSVRFTD